MTHIDAALEFTNKHPNVEKLSSVLKSYTKTVTQRAMITDMIGEMAQDGRSENEVVATLAGTVLDGLRYGNWPWLEDISKELLDGEPRS